MPTFDPPLGVTTEVVVPAEAGHRIDLRFRLDADDGDAGTWQVWTNAGVDQEWKAVDFLREEVVERRETDILVPASSPGSTAPLQAILSFPASGTQEFSYTFRKLELTGDTTWFGDGNNNGIIRVQEGAVSSQEILTMVPEEYRNLDWSAAILTTDDRVVDLRGDPQNAIALFASAPAPNFAVVDGSPALAHLVVFGDPFAVSSQNLLDITGTTIAFSSRLTLSDLCSMALPESLRQRVQRAGSGIAIASPAFSGLTIFRPYGPAERAEVNGSGHSLLVSPGEGPIRCFEPAERIPFFLELGNVIKSFQLLPMAYLGDLRLAIPNAEATTEKQDPEESIPSPDNQVIVPGSNLFTFLQQFLVYIWMLLARLQPKATSLPDDNASVSSEPSDQVQTPPEVASPTLVSVSSFRDIHTSDDEQDPKQPAPPVTTSLFFHCYDLSTIYVAPTANFDALKVFIKKQEWEQVDYTISKGEIMTALDVNVASPCMLRIDYSG